DIGTVLSQSEIITHHAGLSTTIHYQFQDKALNDLLGLDPLHESIYAVVEWRQEEKEGGLQKEGERVRKEGEVGLQKAGAVGLQKAGASPAPTTMGYPSASEVRTGSALEPVCLVPQVCTGSAQGTTPTAPVFGTVNASA